MALGLYSQLTPSGPNVNIIPGFTSFEGKTRNIPSIREAQGYLWFIARGIPHVDVVRPETMLFLSVEDCAGIAYSVSRTLLEINKGRWPSASLATNPTTEAPSSPCRLSSQQELRGKRFATYFGLDKCLCLSR